MAEHRCLAENGWTGIMSALAKAVAGDRVTIADGTFRGSETLTLTSGVTLAGSPETRLEFEGDSPAIMARDADGVTVENLTIFAMDTGIAKRILPWSEPPPEDDYAPAEWGLVYFDHCRNSRIDGVVLQGQQQRWLSGIVIRRCTSTAITKCQTVDFGNSGISLFSPIDCIATNNHASSCAYGILLLRLRNQAKMPSQAHITGNFCYNNRITGIVLVSAESEELSDNECWKNTHGITLQRGANISDIPSRARIIGNRCHGNQESGIILVSSESEELSGNECWENTYGITLQRRANIADAPSRARITDNRCHGNRESGITLVSSESEELSGNECWENVDGITLQRGKNNADTPSRARIIDNRCHGNDQSGIALFSSESEELTGNECWKNALGITLLRSEYSLNSPAQARISGNRCHGNRNTGIVLFSSESEEQSNNECWDNAFQGIAILRGDRTPNALSRACITANRCHDNGAGGFLCDAAAEVSEHGNFVWRNGEPSVAIAPDEQPLHPLDWDFIIPDETPDETLARIRRSAVGGAIARILDSDGIRDPDRLGRYVAGPGSIHDLVNWFDSATDIEPQADTIDPKHENAAAGLFRLVPPDADADANTIRFEATPRQSLTGAVWRRASAHVLKKEPGAAIIGTFGDNRAAIDALIDDCERVNGFSVDDAEPGVPVPTQMPELVRMLPITGMRIARPVIVDYTARSELALSHDEPRLAFAEPDLAGWRATGSRLRFFFTSPPLLLKTAGVVAGLLGLLFVAGILKGFPDPWHDPFGAILRALTSNLKSFEAYDWLTLPVAVATALAGFLAVFRRNFPTHLKLDTPSWLRRFSGEHDTGDTAPPPRGKPWRRWVKREIYAGGDVCFLILRNVQEWLDDDRRALREILAMRPEDKSLVVIVEAPTKAILDRTLLRPIYDTETARLDQTGLDAVEAFLGPEPGFIELDPAGDHPDLDNLLGLKGDKTELRREQVLAGIGSEDFSIGGDIIPMLAIGSTHISPFILSRRVDPTHRNFLAEFSLELQRYARMVEGDSTFELNLSNDAEALQQNLAEASASSAVRMFRHRRGRRDDYELMGRFQRRNDMVRMLADIFDPSSAHKAEYVAVMVQCGQLQALNQITTALTDQDGKAPRLAKAMTSLRSALFLRREYQHLSGIASLPAHEARTRMLDAAWKEARDGVERLDVPDPSDEQVTVAAKLFAASLQVGTETYDVNHALQRPADGLPFAERCFLARIRHALTFFETFDRKLAQERAINELRPLFAQMPAEEINTTQEVVASHMRKGRDLSQFIDAVQSADDLFDLMDRHTAIADDMLATLFSTLAIHARTEEQQLDLARTVVKLQATGLRLPVDARPRGVSKDLAVPFDALLGFVKHPDFVAATHPGDTARERTSFEIVDLMYGSMSDLAGTADDRMDIEFKGKPAMFGPHTNGIPATGYRPADDLSHSASFPQ